MFKQGALRPAAASIAKPKGKPREVVDNAKKKIKVV